MGLLTIDSLRGLSKRKGSAGKKPSIPDETLWRLSASLTNSVDNRVLEETVRVDLEKIGVEIDEQDVQAYHCLKEKERTVVTFLNRKDCL